MYNVLLTSGLYIYKQQGIGDEVVRLFQGNKETKDFNAFR